MPPIAKPHATQIATVYNAMLTDRSFDALEANARVGVIGATVPYGLTGNIAINVAKAALEARGWTVMRDDVNSVLVVS